MRRVFLAFPIDGLHPPQPGHRPAGPARVLNATRAEGRAELAIAADRQVVLVIGGSLGARSLNLAAADAWAATTPASRSST